MKLKLLLKLGQLPDLITETLEAIKAGTAFVFWIQTYVNDPLIRRKASEVQLELDEAVAAWKKITK